MMPKNNFKDMPSILKNVLNKYNLRESVLKDKIINNWESMVGKKIANQCTPVALTGNILTIRAKDNIWKQELAHRQKDLVNLLNEQLQSSFVKKINII
jgi:predicted nucleic acid-binding Zn ribbon protein